MVYLGPVCLPLNGIEPLTDSEEWGVQRCLATGAERDIADRLRGEGAERLRLGATLKGSEVGRAERR